MEVKGFNSLEEMHEYMAQQTDLANENLHPVQVDLRNDVTAPRFWVRPSPEEGCLIFGHAYSFTELCDVESAFVNPQDEESIDEFRWTIRAMRENRQRGFLTGRMYSIFMPEGDPHDNHVAEVFPISTEAFEEAKAAGWKAVHITLFDLDLMGEAAARQAGWTPTLVRELQALQNLIDQTREV